MAGRGSAPNTAGYVELDASIMDGARMRAGGVAAVRDVAHPVAAARRVMDATDHVLLAGEGAMAFIREQGLDLVKDPTRYYRIPDRIERSDFEDPKAAAHGTVGAVALDRRAPPGARSESAPGGSAIRL